MLSLTTIGLAACGAIFLVNLRAYLKKRKEAQLKEQTGAKAAQTLEAIATNLEEKSYTRPVPASIWPGEDIKPILGEKTIVEWLQQRGPDPELWHFIALFTIPDSRNLELYRWLVLQPKLDAATAISLFHSLECWEMLQINPSKIAENDVWIRDRFFIAKTISDRFQSRRFQPPSFTVFKNEDDLTKVAFEQEIASAIANLGRAPFQVSDAIFDYGVRQKIRLTHHYSDYHYNPYGSKTGDIIVLEGPYEELLSNY